MAKFCEKCGASLKDTNGICQNCSESPKYSIDGMINKKAIKESAKARLNGNIFKLLVPYLICVLIYLFFTVLIEIFISEENLLGMIVNVLVEFSIVPMIMGVTYYYLKFVRGEEFKLVDLVEYYDKRIFTIFALTFLTYLFTFLWSILFLIPGIVAMISYSMCSYIYVDGKVKDDPLAVIRESKRLMNGYKSDYFEFICSFLGWILLGFISMGFAFIYVLPYISVSNVMYYEEIRKIKG